MNKKQIKTNESWALAWALLENFDQEWMEGGGLRVDVVELLGV